MKKLVLLLCSTLVLMVVCHFKLSGKSDTEHFPYSLKPNIRLTIEGGSKIQDWGQRKRYRIRVQDPIDGDSKYNEINPSEVFLSIRFYPNATDSAKLINNKMITDFSKSKGLRLMGRGTCFGCHSNQTSKIGPSLREIASSVGASKNKKANLANSVKNGSVGKWGDNEMPANPQYTDKEIASMIDFILEQGGCKDCWIYPGLEGAFQITHKPDEVNVGLYLITATYTSSNGKHGEESMVLKIK